MNHKKLKVAVLMGGPSSEHEVSLSSGKTVIKNLDKRKYEIKPVIISKEGKWLVPEGWDHSVTPSKVEGSHTVTGGSGGEILRLRPSGSAQNDKVVVSLSEPQALKKLKKEKTDVVFVALHGEYGEDGTVQRALDKAGLVYTASGPEASILGMDKLKSLKLFKAKGLETPEFLVFTQEEWMQNTQEIIKKIKKEMKFPAVVKPVSRGSSVGVAIAEDEEGLAEAVNAAFKYDQRVMIQVYIRGREITCGVLDNGKERITPLIPTEMIPKERPFFDYHSKYVAGATDELTPPPDLPQKTIRAVQNAATLTHRIVGASGMSRTDMVLGENGKIYVLEINTIPGLTQTSLLPQEAKAVGISFSEMLDRVIKAAINRHKS